MESEAPTVAISFRAVGPITRSTLPDGPAEPESEALNDVLHWLWATRTQIRRLTEGIRTELTSNQLRALSRRRTFSQTSLDEHLLLVCAGQFEKAARTAREYFPEVNLSAPLQVALRHLRNVYEHWEQHRDTFR